MMIPDWLGPRMGTDRLMYLAHPTRKNKQGIGPRLKEFAKSLGYYGINPFDLGDKLEFDPLVGRDATLFLDKNVQRGNGVTGILGISAGVMGEGRDRLEWDPLANFRICRRDASGDFDELWDEEYARLSRLPEYGDVFADIRKRYRRLIVFVGPSAVGKTYCIEQLRAYCGMNLSQIKTVTTRPARDENDDEYYYRVSNEQFRHGVEHRAFLDYDEYLEASYGSSLDEVKRILRASNGIFALTPKGAKAYFDCREELDVSIILLQPESEAVLLKNLMRRKELDPKAVREKLAKAKEFVLPSEIKHEVVIMTGTEYDRERVFEKVLPLLK